MGEVNGNDPMVDAELVLRFQEGSEGAFDDLVRRHMEAAYRFCLRLSGREGEAEEISQEGFVRAYRMLGSFRGEAHFRSLTQVHFVAKPIRNSCRSNTSEPFLPHNHHILRNPK